MANQDHIIKKISQGSKNQGLSLDDTKLQLLCDYVLMLEKWNKAYNLTAIRNLDDMLDLHLLDSLSLFPELENQNVDDLIDVGTGGGLPGIPLAICYPEKTITLLDTNGKKTRFLQQVKHTLGLQNVTVVQARCEEFEREDSKPFDAVISRAFASLVDMVEGCRHFLKQDGCFLAMKGQYPEQEIADLPASVCLDTVVPLNVPNVDGERQLVILRHAQ